MFAIFIASPDLQFSLVLITASLNIDCTSTGKVELAMNTLFIYTTITFHQQPNVHTVWVFAEMRLFKR